MRDVIVHHPDASGGYFQIQREEHDDDSVTFETYWLGGYREWTDALTEAFPGIAWDVWENGDDMWGSSPPSVLVAVHKTLKGAARWAETQAARFTSAELEAAYLGGGS